MKRNDRLYGGLLSFLYSVSRCLSVQDISFVPVNPRTPDPGPGSAKSDGTVSHRAFGEAGTDKVSQKFICGEGGGGYPGLKAGIPTRTNDCPRGYRQCLVVLAPPLRVRGN